MNKHVAVVIWAMCFYSCAEVQYKHGERSYISYCASCHMDDGSGLEALVPDLFYNETDRHVLDKFPCMIRHGIRDSLSVFQMPANKRISPIDITNIMNYIANDMNDLDTVYALRTVHVKLEECDTLTGSTSIR